MYACVANRQNRDVRRTLVWALFWSTSLAYVAMVTWWLMTVPRAPDINELLWTLFIVPLPVLTGVYLMWRRPENQIGELLTASSIFSYVILTLLEIPTVASFEASGGQSWMWLPMWLSQVFMALGVVLTIAMVVVLPDGHFRYTRERRLVAAAWITLVFPTLALISNETVITDDLSFPGVVDIPSPLVIDSLVPFGSTMSALLPVGYLMVVGALVMLFLRYRDGSERERKQIRWVVYGGAMAALIPLTAFVLSEIGFIPPRDHTIAGLLYSLPIVGFPVSIVVAVMEPPWVDVDIVIRKSFVYGALSFLILVLYIAAAASLGVVAAGARLDIEIAVIITVIVALLFQPARRRLQMVADRWVFGERPTKYEAVAEFGETLEQVARPEELLPRLVETIRKAIRLTWVTASLDDGTHAESGAVPGKPALTVPIGVGTDEVGTIRCGPKISGSLDSDERHLVQTLAAQIGLAVMNARLAGRIVNAAESERRRIERNIHDGAQQELVALVARLGMARVNAANGALAAETIEELQEEAKTILAELRELAQGIHPSVLSDGGLLEAVEDRCARLPIEVSLRAPESLRATRFHDDVEGAAYFFVSESLANVLKHSGATKVEVTLERGADRIELAVADNGCGFDPDTGQRNGLVGLSDRMRALGGAVTVASDAESGTVVHASLPATRP
jgi:signal transduction histidine kinase